MFSLDISLLEGVNIDGNIDAICKQLSNKHSEPWANPWAESIKCISAVIVRCDLFLHLPASSFQEQVPLTCSDCAPEPFDTTFKKHAFTHIPPI